MNFVDLLSIVPFYAEFGSTWYAAVTKQAFVSRASSLPLIRIMRVVRVFRILRLTRFTKGLQILSRALMASLDELAMLSLFLSIGVVIFSTAVYYAETVLDDSQYANIPDGFWWAIITSKFSATPCWRLDS